MTGTLKTVEAINYRNRVYYEPLFDFFEAQYGARVISNIISPKDKIEAIEAFVDKAEEAKSGCIYMPGQALVDEHNYVANLRPFYKQAQRELSYYEQKVKIRNQHRDQIEKVLDDELEFEMSRREELLGRAEQIKKWLDDGE